MPLSGSSSVDTLSSTGSVDSHVAEPTSGAGANPLRPPKSPRRPSNSLRPASTTSVHQIDLAHPARAFYGLPSPPTTSSEASGGSVGGSLRLPGSVLQPAVPAPAGPAGRPRETEVRASERATSSQSGLSRVTEDDGGRSKRLSDLKERSAKIINSLSSRQTPSPTKPLLDSPMARLTQGVEATAISSPKLRSAHSSSRQSLSGEETERGGTRSGSSQASTSSFSDRGGNQRPRTNGTKKGKRVSIDSSASGGSGWPQPPPASSPARGHGRTASLPHSAGSSDGGFSRSSGETSGRSSNQARRQHRPSSSTDLGRLASPGPSATPMTRRLHGTSSPNSSSALSRSQSTTSVSSRDSDSRASVAGRTPLRAAATRVRPSPSSKRSDDGPTQEPTSTLSAPRATPSHSQTSRTTSSMASSPSMTSLASARLQREASSSSSSSHSRSSAGPRSRLGSSPLIDTLHRPGQERQTSADSAEEVDALLGEGSQRAPSQSDDDPRPRERTASSGKRRAPLPSEFLTGSGMSSPLSARDGPQRRSDARMPLSPSLASLSSYSAQPSSSSRPRYPSLSRHSPSPLTDTASSFGRRTRASLPSDALPERQPRYAGRGGSSESALARHPTGSQRGDRANGIAFPSTGGRDDDLFSESGSEAAESRASRTRSLLQRIEQENLESERRTRQLREVHAMKRAESSMSLSRSPTSSDFQPATPLHKRDHSGVGVSRGGAYTGLPARPSTSMAYTTEAPRTAPPLGLGLRSHRSAWNLQTPSSSGSQSGHREGSPSPSLVRRRRLSGDPSRLGSDAGRRTPMDLRSTSSYGMPASVSVQSGLSSFADTDSSQPDHVRNMLAASEALKRHYSRLADLFSTAEVVRTADALVSAVEQTNHALVEASRFVREELVASQVDDRGQFADVKSWQAMSAILKDAMRMSDEEVRALAAQLIAALRSSREQLAVAGANLAAGSAAGMRRSETADWTAQHRYGREGSEPASLRIDPQARPSTSMGYSTIGSPSVRLRDAALTRERLASIPSSRTLDLIDVDAPRDDGLQEEDLSPPPATRRSGVLGHVFDRFASRRSSEEQVRDSPERTWRQAKTSSASTVRGAAAPPSLVRAPSLSAPMVSPATTDLSTVTAMHVSPDRDGGELPAEGTPARGYFGRAKTLSLASASSPMARHGSADSDSTLGRRNGGSHHSLSSAAEEDPQQRRRSGPETSPISSIRRLSLFGGPRDH